MGIENPWLRTESGHPNQNHIRARKETESTRHKHALAISALLLALIFRPKFDRQILQHTRLLLAYGATLALMNWCFYESIARIPLGLAVTIEFMGPLGVAVLSSRRRIDLLWVSISIAGLIILTPEIGGNIDPVGFVFAAPVPFLSAPVKTAA